MLFQNLIPLELAVNLMCFRMCYIPFVENDAEMIDDEKSMEQGQVVGCSVRSNHLLEDLARVTHVFCDKTGTLTKN